MHPYHPFRSSFRWHLRPSFRQHLPHSFRRQTCHPYVSTVFAFPFMQSIPRTQHNTTNYTAARFKVPRPCTYIAHRPSVRRVFVFVFVSIRSCFRGEWKACFAARLGALSGRIRYSLQRWVGSGACTVYVDIPVWREGEGFLCTSTSLYHFHVRLFFGVVHLLAKD